MPTDYGNPGPNDGSLRSVHTRKALVVFAVLAAVSTRAAVNPCDPLLVQPETDPNGYRLRGDRCEGVFVRQVSGSASLLIASFTRNFAEFDPRSGKDLRLEWVVASEARPTTLRAHGLRRRQYYRMDAERPPGTRSYTWPTTVLGNLDISRRFLGVLAWTDMDIGSGSRRVHLPLQVGSEPFRSPLRGYELILVPEVELTEIFLTLSSIGDGPARTRFRDRPLSYGYYPQLQGVRIPISDLDRTGVYSLQIGATQRNGASTTTGFWFYHAGW